MKQTRLIMGMPVTLEIVDPDKQSLIETVFDYFVSIDITFSTYKKDSEISKFNRGEIKKAYLGKDVQLVLALAEKTKQETDGYFDIQKSDGSIDPSGLVKGWAIWTAAKNLGKKGVKNFYIDAGGDIQVFGENEKGHIWKIGIKNPFDQTKIVKVLQLDDKGLATSGTYIRGNHIYDPKEKKSLNTIVSLTVIGPNVYEADRFATASFAMGEKGITFIENLEGFEGYQIDKNGKAVYTSGFERFVVS